MQGSRPGGAYFSVRLCKKMKSCSPPPHFFFFNLSVEGREDGITFNERERMMLNFRGIPVVWMLPRFTGDLENKNVTLL